MTVYLPILGFHHSLWLHKRDFMKPPVNVDHIFLSFWQSHRGSCVCVLNYMRGDAPGEVAGNTDDFSLCPAEPVINTDRTHLSVSRISDRTQFHLLSEWQIRSWQVWAHCWGALGGHGRWLDMLKKNVSKGKQILWAILQKKYGSLWYDSLFPLIALLICDPPSPGRAIDYCLSKKMWVRR